MSQTAKPPVAPSPPRPAPGKGARAAERAQQHGWLLWPGEGGWEIWEMDSAGKPVFSRACADPAAESLPAASIVAAPACAAYFLPLWMLKTDDPEVLKPMIRLQFERHGFDSGGEGDSSLAWQAAVKDETRVLVWACAFGPDFPKELCFGGGTGYDIAARWLPVPPDSIVVWRELGRVVYAFTRGPMIVYAAATNEPELSHDALIDIWCARQNLLAAEAIMPRAKVVAWCPLPGPVHDSLLNIGVEVEIAQRPPPRQPPAAWAILPRQVAHARAAAAGRRKKIRIGLACAAVYLAVLLVFAGRWGWVKIQNNTLEKSLSPLRPEVAKLQTAFKRWQSLERTLDPAISPIEILFQVSRPLPESGIRFLSFNAEDGKITITGEATNAQTAFVYSEKIKAQPELAHLNWLMPQPSLSPNGTAKFTITGEAAHGAGTAAP